MASDPSQNSSDESKSSGKDDAPDQPSGGAKQRADGQDVSGFEDLIDQMLEESDGDGFSVQDMLDAFAHRSFGPLVLVPALLATLPTGVIPGIPVLLGLVIVLVCGQVLIGRRSPWIPHRLREVEVDRDMLRRSQERFRPWFRRVDAVLRPRLRFLTRPPFVQVVALLAILLAVSFVPLEFIPFAVAVPGLALTAFGIGMATEDGLVILLGLLLCGATAWLCWATLGG